MMMRRRKVELGGVVKDRGGLYTLQEALLSSERRCYIHKRDQFTPPPPGSTPEQEEELSPVCGGETDCSS